MLHHHLLADSDELCRAWSASSLMQMSFNRGRKGTIRKRSASVLREAIEKETDLFALGTMIDTVQTLWDKKFGLSGIAVEERREASIQKARKSAIRFWKIVYNELELEVNAELQLEIMKVVITLLICIAMATCSNTKRGTSSEKETGDIPIAENYGDSLVGKFVTNLYEFKLYNQPEGKVTEELYPARHYGGHVKEKKGDWIRFEDLRAINKLAVSFSGWTKWREMIR